MTLTTSTVCNVGAPYSGGYMPLNFSEVDEHRIAKFSALFGPRSSLVRTNCRPSGRGQGHVTSLLFGKYMYMPKSKDGEVTLTTPPSGTVILVIRELTLDIAYNYTKFDDSSLSNSRDI